jgi:fructokinase
MTIGTGLGVGVVIEGKLVHGLQHPEGGHIRVNRHPEDSFKGICPIHGDCLEGLVTNNAIKERKNLESVELCQNVSDEDPIWNFISYYIAQLCLNLLYLNSLQKILIGGGIINRTNLLRLIREHFISLNNSYIDNELLKENVQNYIDRTAFGNYSGILSAFALI